MALMRREHFEFPELWRRFFEPDSFGGQWLRVEEFMDGTTVVVRAELPGLDPDKDVEVTISDGELHIRAERQEKAEHKEKESYRSEFHYGSFYRTFPLPSGTKEGDVKASYCDGILEVRVPMGEPAKALVTKVPVTTA